MRVALVADLHLGNHLLFGGPMQGGINSRCRDTYKVLERSVETASEDGADAFVVAGDLLDTDTPSPSVLNLAMRALSKWKSPNLVLLNGNHDMTSVAEGHTALAPLQWVPGSLVATSDRIVDLEGGQILLVPHRPGPAKDWLPVAVKHLLDGAHSAKHRLLVVHLGLESASTPPWLRGSDDSIHVDQLASICEEHGIRHVASGNWHSAWETKIRGIHLRQIGALVPTGFDNPGDGDCYGNVIWWEVDEVGARFATATILYGPRFVKLCSLQQAEEFQARLQEQVDHDQVLGNTYYIHIQVPSEELESVEAIVESIQAEDRISVGGVKRSTPPKERQNLAKEAAASVGASDSLSEALHNYVDALHLSESMTREVKRLCFRYLKLGGTA